MHASGVSLYDHYETRKVKEEGAIGGKREKYRKNERYVSVVHNFRLECLEGASQ
jgi:hypothetical protein